MNVFAINGFIAFSKSSTKLSYLFLLLWILVISIVAMEIDSEFVYVSFFGHNIAFLRSLRVLFKLWCLRFWVLYRAKQDGPVVLVRPSLCFTYRCYVIYAWTDFHIVFFRVGDIPGRVMMIMVMGMMNIIRYNLSLYASDSTRQLHIAFVCFLDVMLYILWWVVTFGREIFELKSSYF